MRGLRRRGRAVVRREVMADSRATPDPVLLTPGPVTTSATIKAAMLRDWGSRDAVVIDMTRRLRRHLTTLAGGDGTHVCVPLQGSGTFAIEATIGTLLSPTGKLLVLINGAYGRRMATIAGVIGRRVVALQWPEVDPIEADRTRAGAQCRPRDHPCCRRSLRDHDRHPESDRRCGAGMRTARAAADHRRDERVRRASAGRP